MSATSQKWLLRAAPWFLPVGIVALWQLASSTGWLSSRILPSPEGVVEAFWSLSVSGELWQHLAISSWRAAIGFSIGGSIGLVLGLVSGLSRWGERLLDTSIQMLRNVPHLARYPLVDFEDTEGLAYLGNGRLAISDEQKQRLDVITLPDHPQPIHASEAQWITLDINPTFRNKGFEGVTYDRQHDRLFAIKERDPRQLFTVTGMLTALSGGPLQMTVSDRRDWVKRSVYATDLSDGYYDPRTGHLLVLSDQSKNITELDGDGRFVSIRSLRAWLGGLHRDAPQPEGMTMDSAGNLYIVSEPNLFYVFSKP